jgi:sugar lactone lactonase YvrE
METRKRVNFRIEALLVLFIAFFFIKHKASAQIITTYAGNGLSGYSGDGGAATAAKIGSLGGITFDKYGNLYISDSANVIRKVSTNGIITTFAGSGTQGYSGDGGTATAAKLNGPNGMCFDAVGNLYFVDMGNKRIRKIDTAGIITTIAGNGSSTSSGNNIAAINASFSYIADVKIDLYGNFYVTDFNAIRKIDTNGIITTFAGNLTNSGYSGDGGQATNALLNTPYAMAFDLYGNLYFTDFNNAAIRKVDANNIITTIAGNGSLGHTGDGGPASAAQVDLSGGIALDTIGNIYFSEQGYATIRKIDAVYGNISTIVGDTTGFASHYSNAGAYGGDGGLASLGKLNLPYGIGFDKKNNMYIVDVGNYRVRKVTACYNPLTLTSPSKLSTCSGKPVQLISSGAHNYSWQPSTGLSSTFASSPASTVSATTVYTLTAKDSSANCIALAYDTVYVAPCLVWPGDANEDLNVDNLDLLTLGVKYGETGPARNIVSNSYQGFACNNWSDTLDNGYNTKYADCNGDGTINMDDTLAINLNYGTSHNMRMASPTIVQSNNPDIYLHFNKTSYTPGDIVSIDVMLGSSTTPQNNFYGTAFTIQYDASKVQSGTESFGFVNSWVGTLNQNMIRMSNTGGGNVAASLARINHSNVNGFGKIASLQFTLKNTLSNTELYITVSNAIKISSTGASAALNAGTDSVGVVNGTTGIQNRQYNNQVTVYPNPTVGNITVSGLMSYQATRIEIVDMLGNVVKAFSGFTNQEASFDISDLSNGMYLVHVIGEGGKKTTQQIKLTR